MERPDRDQGDLVVIHEDPAPVRAFIPPGAVERVRFLTAGVLVETEVGVDGLERHRGGTPEVGVVCLPVDGPPAATELAVALLERERRVICLYGTNHQPVDWWVLGLAAGSPIGLDLRRVKWHDRDGMWWTACGGPTWLPMSPSGPEGSRRTAGVLIALSESSTHDDVVTGWLAAVAAGSISPDGAAWSAALCARYLRQAASQAARVRPWCGEKVEKCE